MTESRTIQLRSTLSTNGKSRLNRVVWECVQQQCDDRIQNNPTTIDSEHKQEEPSEPRAAEERLLHVMTESRTIQLRSTLSTKQEEPSEPRCELPQQQRRFCARH
eukprot:TRINITY_DN29247_c0_g1_i1.p1 TRINITY_DN29247_c0_g1~~TRINITY_DN29247_c0_g1_i1.p1  ORF type:complete len:105 (+),score=3.22 TRINITY_DN29247_c0_g1_i1:219-533(+)